MAGTVETVHCLLAGLRVGAGAARVRGCEFGFSRQGPCRLEIACAGARLGPGAHASRVSVVSSRTAFTFFLRDVSSSWPIVIPEYGVAVTLASDRRSYTEIEDARQGKGLDSELERIAIEPEETFAGACAATRSQFSPTWLGLGRDMRVFRVGYDPKMGFWGYVQPCLHFTRLACEEMRNSPAGFRYAVGRGSAASVRISRRLEDGCLPILCSTQWDGPV